VRYSTLFKRVLDCPKAFTQANLNTPCYLKAPPGMKIPIGWCIELLKSPSTDSSKPADCFINCWLCSY
jgi:hypothetical protein